MQGNERLTAAVAVLLLVLLAVEGATVPFIGQLLTLHVLVGMVLVPLVALKIASTGYRFARYYTGSRSYVQKGPPRPLLRVLGPLLIVLTVTMFASGILLTIQHPAQGLLLLVHKVSFVLWFGVTTVHVLTYVWRVPALAARDWLRRRDSSGRSGLARGGAVGGGAVGGGAVGGGAVGGVLARRVLLLVVVLGGLVLAWVSLPWLPPWQHFLGGRGG